MSELRVEVPVLARVEGEGALHLVVRDGVIVDATLQVYEPPRFFEGFLRGRHYDEPVDITARICGICPVAYQMSAVHALESLCGVTVEPGVRDLRRLLYCGEWIESHLLHIAFLHAPDFLGLSSGIEMASVLPDVVEMALRMKKLGNDVMEVIGGRAIHPINVRLGGFYRLPRRADLEALLPELRWASDHLPDVVRWTAALPMPDFTTDPVRVALRHPDEYPMNEGRIVSSDGLDISVGEFEDNFAERHVPHSTALHGHLVDGRPYAVGPVARFDLNHDRLPPRVLDLCAEVGLVAPVRNPFRSIVVRAIETLYAVDEAIRLIEGYVPPSVPHVGVTPHAGIGYAATEAPRGTLYHRYELSSDGTIVSARIVPPTAQVQPVIEADLRAFAGAFLELPEAELALRCETIIRNYDPCLSCSTHFLRVTIDRG